MRCFPAVLLVLAVLVGQALFASCALSCFPVNSFLGFGYGNYGQLGTGYTSTYNFDPVSVYRSGVLSGLNITSVAAGWYHTLVLASNGEVYSFGRNNNGQLGDGTGFEQDYPVAVDNTGFLNFSTIAAVAAGYYHSLVLTESGNVFSFGDNNYGQLGDGSYIDRYTPVAVDTSDVLAGLKITAISAGAYFSLVLSDTGSVFSFGDNSYGQLGDGTMTTRNIPVSVYTLGLLNTTSIKAISAGAYHSLLLSTTGNVYSFGNHGDGQLGDGSIVSYSTLPVAVSTSGVLNGTIISAVSAGDTHSLVLSATGQVYSFGDNSNGQLGDGTTTDRNVPVAVNTSGVLNGVNIISISAGGQHSLVMSATGYVYSFGDNIYGQLGDGTQTDRSFAVSPRLDAYDIIAFDAGRYHSMVISSVLQNIASGVVRDGSSSGVQRSFQSTTNYIYANWDTFMSVYETGRSRPITDYQISTFEVQTGIQVLSPQSVTSSGESIVSTSQWVYPYLVHNRSYYSIINASICPEISRTSPGFLVDTTNPLVGEVHTLTDLWLVGGNFTFKWNGISDPESGIDYLRIQFRNEATGSILSQTCDVMTSASSGSANVSWENCNTWNLPPVTPLSLIVQVYNRAGGSSLMWNQTNFQVAGIRITDVISYSGLSSTSFKQCRRAIVEWVSIGLNDTFVMPSLSGSSMWNMSDTAIPIERNRFELEPVPSTFPPGSGYYLSVTSLIPYSPAPYAYVSSVSVSADDTCIKITSPDESTLWESGTIQTVKWSSTSLTGSITLELLQDSESVSLIGSSLVAAHKFNWEVPYNLKENAKFQIRAESLDVPGVVFTTNAIELSVLNAGHRIEISSAVAIMFALLVNLAIFAVAL